MTPSVSIGMPVLNGERTLSRALESLDQQRFSDYEICISDNASTDATEEIIRTAKKKNPRIQSFRQSRTLQASTNFHFVLNQSRGKYFMWAAADDLWSPNFLDANVRSLEKNSGWVASAAKNQHPNDPLRAITFECLGDKFMRLKKLLQNIWDSHAIFYSLMRTEVIRKCPQLGKNSPAADWAIDCFLVGQGEVGRVENAEIHFGNEGFSHQKDPYRAFSPTWMDRIWPTARFTKCALTAMKGLSFAQKIRLNRYLLKINGEVLQGHYGRER